MAKTRIMTSIQNHDDASSKKRLNACALRPWPDLNHDLLLLVMKRLGVVDFLAFNRVCKSWRSFALYNRKTFMASKPPMSIRICNEKVCHVKDFEGRKFKTLLPFYAKRTCHGITCGYLILFGRETKDFWLVNPITRHQLHFPCFPMYISSHSGIAKAILVFSTSLSRWVFVMVNRSTDEMWFSIAGKVAWNHVSSTSPILDLHFFKGKIYVLNNSYHLFEMRLNPKPKLMLLKTKSFPDQCFHPEFVSLGENLCLMQFKSRRLFKVNELDFCKMEWVSSKEPTEEYAFCCSNLENVAVKIDTWADPRSQYGNYVGSDKRRKGRLINVRMWYFPHDCLNVNVIHE